MSLIKEYKSNAVSPDDRKLGDEWLDWNGQEDGAPQVGKGLFLWFAFFVAVITSGALVLFVYFITPRLELFFEELPKAAWALAALYVLVAFSWFSELVLTTYREKSYFLFRHKNHKIFDRMCAKVINLAMFFGISRDRIGHSFVKVSNAVSRASKPKGRKERLLVLLPRCLTKEEIKKAMELKERYHFDIFTVSGGELARQKVRELKPTAVIGVACERDLVSGIRDVGGRLSVIGIPNKRPNGPCKDTHVDMEELETAIKFYVGEESETAP